MSFVRCRLSITANGLRLCEEADIEAQNCLPALNLIRSSKLQLSAEPSISCRCRYKLPYLFIIQVQTFIIVLFC